VTEESVLEDYIHARFMAAYSKISMPGHYKLLVDSKTLEGL
jgi:hypothetical protein